MGYIRYGILGRIGTGLFHVDHRVNIPVQVCKTVDINLPQFLIPVHQTKHKQVGCLCCVSGNIEFTIDIPRTGFCISGDCVSLSVMVENGSGRNITMRAEISKLVTFIAGASRRFNRNTLALVHSEAILPHSTNTWNPENLIVPMVEPTISESKIIHVEYFLKVWAAVPYATNPSIVIPILLGNVPYQGSAETAVTAPTIDFASYPASEVPWPDNPGPQPTGATLDAPLLT